MSRLSRRGEMAQDEPPVAAVIEPVRCQFFEHAQPMHNRFVEPQRRQAGRIIESPVKVEDLEGLVQKLLRL